MIENAAIWRRRNAITERPDVQLTTGCANGGDAARPAGTRLVDVASCQDGILLGADQGLYLGQPSQFHCFSLKSAAAAFAGAACSPLRTRQQHRAHSHMR
jgi:hypothetical protein